MVSRGALTHCAAGTTPDANVLVKQLRNVDGLRFGNDVYSVEFNSRHRDKAFPGTHPFGVEYTFTLKDAVDGVPEYLVPFDTLLALAKEEGLQLVYRANFHDFVKLMTTDEEAMQLARQSKVFGDGLRESTFTPPEWEAARLYCVFAFQKVRFRCRAAWVSANQTRQSALKHAKAGAVGTI